MPKSRRQRSGEEGTFLESVKVLLGKVLAEVEDVKSIVGQLQSQSCCIPAYGYDSAVPSSGDWIAWNSADHLSHMHYTDGQASDAALGELAPDASEGALSSPAPLDVQGNTNADTFAPITAAGNDVFSKAGLLSLRGPLSPDVPDEIAGLSAIKIGDDSPPCDGSSLGSDTSLEEAACQGERGANQGGRCENEDFTFTKEQVRHLLDQNNHHIRLQLEERLNRLTGESLKIKKSASPICGMSSRKFPKS